MKLYLDALKDLEECSVQLILKYDRYTVEIEDDDYHIVDNEGYARSHAMEKVMRRKTLHVDNVPVGGFQEEFVRYKVDDHREGKGRVDPVVVGTTCGVQCPLG